MSEFDEFELRPEAAHAPDSGPPRDRSFGLVLAGVLAVAAAVGGLGYVLFLRGAPAPAASPAAVAASAAATPFPGPEAFGLPSLDASDAFVREEAKGLSSHPLLGLWLGQQGIVRLVTNVVDTVSKGESPRQSLAFLAPKGPFAVAQRKGQLIIDAASYARYDFFAEGVASFDTAAGARLFRRALPLLEAAYRELGYPQGGFEAALRGAIAGLLAVPVVTTELAVEPVRRGDVLVYACSDPGLEALSPAQKHLLRMGPSNVQRVQGVLRGFLSALGS